MKKVFISILVGFVSFSVSAQKKMYIKSITVDSIFYPPSKTSPDFQFVLQYNDPNLSSFGGSPVSRVSRTVKSSVYSGVDVFPVDVSFDKPMRVHYYDNSVTFAIADPKGFNKSLSVVVYPPLTFSQVREYPSKLRFFKDGNDITLNLIWKD